MAPFEPKDPEFEACVRESFVRLTLMRTLGARLVSVRPGDVVIDLNSREDLTQHHGFIAAAVLTAIADVACGYAAMSLMPPGASVLTVEYKTNFMAPARDERMTARARVVRPGRTVSVCSADVFAVTGREERLVATMLSTMIQVSGEPEAPPRLGHERGHERPPPQMAERPLGRVPRWCICGGRGLKHGLRRAVDANH